MPLNPIIAIKTKRNLKDGDNKYNIYPNTPTTQLDSNIIIRPNLSANLPEINSQINSPKKSKFS